MEVELEVVVWGNVSPLAERSYVERGMPVVIVWAAGQVVEGEKELKRWLVVSAQVSRDGVLNAWRCGLG